MNSKKDHKSIDNTYGGVRYRFSYDDSRRAEAIRLIRQTRRGSRSFWLSVGTVSAFCITLAGLAVLYRGIGDRGSEDTVKEEVKADEVIAVNAVVHSEESREYTGSFAVSDLNDRAQEAYHIPVGIIVAEVYEQKYAENADLVHDGDVITAVDGVKTPDIAAFNDEFTREDKCVVNLSIFRKGKHISLSYVINDEK